MYVDLKALAWPRDRLVTHGVVNHVSVEGARRDYGVVLSGSLDNLTLVADEEATATLRAERRAARIGAAASNSASNSSASR